MQKFNVALLLYSAVLLLLNFDCATLLTHLYRYTVHSFYLSVSKEHHSWRCSSRCRSTATTIWTSWKSFIKLSSCFTKVSQYWTLVCACKLFLLARCAFRWCFNRAGDSQVVQRGTHPQREECIPGTDEKDGWLAPDSRGGVWLRGASHTSWRNNCCMTL